MGKTFGVEYKKVPFAILHKTSYPYIERCIFCAQVKNKGLFDLRTHWRFDLSSPARNNDKCTIQVNPDSTVYVTHKGPTRVLSAPSGPHAGPMNFAIREDLVL